MNKNIIYLVMFLVLFTSVFAVPPVTQVSGGSDGILITYPKYDYVPQNANFTLHINLFNISNGIPLYVAPSCYLHLYNPDGTHTIQSEMGNDIDGQEKILFIGNENFSEIGVHTFTIWCNSTAYSLGGVADGIFEVLPKVVIGSELSPNYDSVLIFGLLLIAFFLVYFSEKFKVEGTNEVKAITSLIIGLILKLSAFATMLFTLMFLKNLLPHGAGLNAMYDTYLLLVFYGLGLIFFLTYFINSIATLADNFNILKENRKIKENRFEKH